MDFDQLETFLEVARHASFSRAAEKRFRTQPAISSQIRGLEEEVGAKLFDRSGGKVWLTAAGKAFQKYVEETLDARKAMLVAIAEMERVPRGEIIVGANEGTCLHILPYVFADFKKQYPDVSVNIKRADYGKILESIIDNSVDFGVISLPVTDPRLTVVLIHRDELILIAPPRGVALLSEGVVSVPPATASLGKDEVRHRCRHREVSPGRAQGWTHAGWDRTTIPRAATEAKFHHGTGFQ